MSGNAVLTLAPGIYNINSLTLSGQSVVTVNPAGQVIIGVARNNVRNPSRSQVPAASPIHLEYPSNSY